MGEEVYNVYDSVGPSMTVLDLPEVTPCVDV